MHLSLCLSRPFQIPSLHLGGSGAHTGVCLTSWDVLKAAWKGIKISIHFSVPIFLPQNGSRKPDGVWRSPLDSFCSPLPNPACKFLPQAALSEQNSPFPGFPVKTAACSTQHQAKNRYRDR